MLVRALRGELLHSGNPSAHPAPAIPFLSGTPRYTAQCVARAQITPSFLHRLAGTIVSGYRHLKEHVAKLTALEDCMLYDTHIPSGLYVMSLYSHIHTYRCTCVDPKT